jgi:hypothetical protein
MTESLHPAASHHLPMFITAPGETDVLMVVTGLILLLSVLGFGILFLRLHTMPERIAHKGHKLQFEIVAVLGLISLFTHMHIFWILGLLLALIDIPDFTTPLNRIAGSAEKLAGVESSEDAGDASSQTIASSKHTDEAERPSQAHVPLTQGDAAAAAPSKPEVAPTKQKERIHA